MQAESPPPLLRPIVQRQVQPGTEACVYGSRARGRSAARRCRLANSGHDSARHRHQQQMAEKLPGLGLYFSPGNVLLSGVNMNAEKLQTNGKSFENVELGDVSSKKQKIPRRIIHFASGETMEEYSTDEEEQEEDKRDLLPIIDASKLPWGPFLWFYMIRFATGTLSVCDFLGEKLASLFGINAPKYQYAIDEYYRIKKEEEEEEEENKMSEEAEKNYQEQMEKQQDVVSAHDGLPAVNASFVNVSFEIENDPTLVSDTKQRVDPIPT